MAIPFIPTPSMEGTPLRQPSPRAAALGAPAVALGDVARGIASVSQAFAQHADQIQGFENARMESEARQKIAADLADFNNRAATMTDPAALLPELDNVLARTSGYVENDDLPPAVRENLSQWHANAATSARLNTASKAASLSLRRAGMALQNELDAAMEHVDESAFESVATRLQESGLAIPEEIAAKRMKFQQIATQKQIAKAIDADPDTSLEMLQNDDILTKYPNLTPDNRDQLIRYATQKKNIQSAETWEQITLASLDGTILSREDIMNMAREGEITPAQAGSYISAYHGPTEPRHEPLVYDQARAQIYAYDPAEDPTGATRAQLAASIATLPLPKESVKELQNQFSAILNPEEKDIPKHKLAKDYISRIETEWKSEAFGDWFDYSDTEFTTSTGEKKSFTTRVIREKDFDKAVAYRHRVQENFISWLNQQPSDIAPDVVGAKYKEIKAQAIEATNPLDLTPNLGPSFDDIDDLIGEPKPTPAGALPKTSMIPDAHKREASIPYERGGPPANVRYNNPAAAWPRPQDIKYGLIGYGVLKDGENNKIGRFPTPIHGAAANLDLFASKYTGMTMQAAMNKWRGRPSPTPKGYDPNAVIDKNFLSNPDRAIDFFKKMALHESPDFNSMSDADWRAAYDLFQSKQPQQSQGSLEERKSAFFREQRPRTPDEAELGLAALYDDFFASQLPTA